MTKLKLLIFLFILLLAGFLRSYSLDTTPPGLNSDEASLGYDAYSILLTGKDQFGKSFPIFIRSFGTYQSPLYVYLTILPIYFFGMSLFSVKFISVSAGILLAAISFILIYISADKNKFSKASSAMLLVAISPWSIMFSRSATESNLAVTMLASGLLFFILSLKKGGFLILSSVFFALSTYSYHAERIVSSVLLISLLLTFRSYFLKRKSLVFISLITFLVILLPQLFLLFTPGSTKRLDQVNYWSNNFFEQLDKSKSDRHPSVVEKSLFISKEFISHYLTYFSPRSLFLDPDPQDGRSIPDLSVFYPWMVIPFFLGIGFLVVNRNEKLTKVLITSALVTPLAASLTKEPFYTLRAIPILWIITLVISLGVERIIIRFKSDSTRALLITIVVIASIFQFYIHYFIFLKQERSDAFGYPYIKLTEEIRKYPNLHFVVDNGRISPYIWFAFFWKTDPKLLQAQRDFDLKNYYQAVDFNDSRTIDNVEFRAISWTKDPIKDQVLIGDNLAISNGQIKEHYLEYLFEIKNLANQTSLTAFKTHPEKYIKH